MDTNSDQNYTPEQIQKISLWQEYFTVDPSTIKYSGLGMTTLQIPSFYKQNIMKTLKNMSIIDLQYPPQIGNTQLKESVIKYFPPIKHFLQNNIKITEENILNTSGALPGINICIQSLLKPGDEIILLSPLYAPHLVRIGKISNIKFKTCRLKYDESQNVFKMDFESLKKSLTQKTRIFIIINPCNPACNVWSKQQYETLSKIIQDYPNLIVFEDSAYFLYHNDQNPYVPFGSLSQQNFDRSITFYSAGKMLNITGTRLGIIFIPQKLKREVQPFYMKQVAIPASLDFFSMPLNLKGAYQANFYENVRKDIIKIYKRIAQQFAKIGVKLVGWQGTYYAIINVQNMKERIDEKWFIRLDDPNQKDSFLDKAVCRMFLKEYGVGLVPLSEWYLDDLPDKFVRLAFNRNQDDIDFMIKSFEDFFKKTQGRKV